MKHRLKLSSVIALMQDALDSGGDCEVRILVDGDFDEYAGFVTEVERYPQWLLLAGSL